MARVKLLLFVLVISSTALAQLAEPLFFGEKLHDFGDIREADGPAVFEFVVVNRSTRPVKILSVKASCGCTTPGWTKEPIAPGASGFVKASYDPKGRPGYFNKTLAVTTDWDGNALTLQIKGNVVSPTTENDPTSFSVTKGNLRFKVNSFNLNKVFINRDPEAVSFLMRNPTKDSIHFLSVVAPNYIKVITPKAIAPAAIAPIKILFDSKLKGQYGFVSENVEIKTDDKELPEKSFSVYATVEEYFSKLSETELANAPVLSLSANLIKFGNVKAGTVLDREIKLTNTGKKELIIRHAQSNCSCLTITPGLRVLKPGQETAVKISLNTTGRTGPQNKSITIYSTDPQNPVQRVTFTAGVVN